MRRLIVLVLLLVASSLCHAQFTVSRFTISGGGGKSSGGEWQVTGTVGQTDADVVPLCSLDGDVPGLCTGASYRLFGGFWSVYSKGGHPSCEGILNCVFRDGFEVTGP